jgi:hypothetical protein
VTKVLPPQNGAISDFDSFKPAPFGYWSSTGTADFGIEEPGANGSTAAARMMGTGVRQVASFIMTATCTDVTAFDGIVLWAKSPTNTTLAAAFSTPELVPVELGGDCVDGCWGFHTAWLDLTPEWRLFAVPFAKAERLWWAAPLPWNGLIMGVDLGVDAKDFDVWIDEVAFYAGEPPDGAELPP